MATDLFLSDLELLIRSRHPIIFIETQEKERVQSLLMHLADRLKMPFYVWTRTKGLKHQFEHVAARVGRERGFSAADLPLNTEKADSATINPLVALGDVEMRHLPALYNFQGLGSDLEDKTLATKLRDAARQFLEHEGSVVITGEMPAELPNVVRAMSTVVPLPAPNLAEYRDLVEHLYRDLSGRRPIALNMTREEMMTLVRNLQGLTLMEAEKLLTKAMVEDNQLGPDDIKLVIDAKKEVIERAGLLEYYPAEESMADVAGLEGLKAWLKKRRAIIAQPEQAAQFGLEFPKGVLLLGMQGSGKSLCAKAVASDWGLPLLKMDPGSMYNKYIGESEKNFRRATRAAEKMAPVVLWIDEIEKAFASSNDMDGGLSQRVLGAFLSWLQERKGDVFLVATANDVSKLPPELMRKGRFDEIFFVDLPSRGIRQEILALHLQKRRRDPAHYNLSALAQATEGFSGAELEQIIVSGLYTAFAAGSELMDEILLEEAKQTVPLSVTMAEKVDSLRRWASGRAVSAN